MASQPDLTDRDPFWDELPGHLKAFQPRRLERYRLVTVLLIYWEHADSPEFAQEARELGQMFHDVFNYTIEALLIPSDNPQHSVFGRLSRFITTHGDPDQLILLYYGGHGGPTPDSKTSCEWAASNTKDSPILDWSLLQPLLYNTACDIVVFLDCCFAGQAVRAHIQHSMEFLAATDKDQFAPLGTSGLISFTRGLITEIPQLYQANGVVTIPTLQKKLASREAGLQKQPFYLALEEGSAGSIQLRPMSKAKLDETENKTMLVSRDLISTQMVLYMPRRMDKNAKLALLRWLTKDSPRAIENVQFKIDLEQAQAVSELGEKLLDQVPLAHRGHGSYFDPKGRQEIENLLQNMRHILSLPTPFDLSDDEAMKLILEIRQSSSSLLTMLEDCLSYLQSPVLEEANTWSITAATEIKSRIMMRLTLLKANGRDEPSQVVFKEKAGSSQRFRVGTINDQDVLVEYQYGPNDDVTKKQVARVATLHSEPKPSSFGSLVGRGYVFERLFGPRFGFIFEIPNTNRPKYAVLSQLIADLKMVPLDLRIQTARMVCQSVLNLHSIGWLHKGIKSENVLLFAEDTTEGNPRAYDFSRPYLVGFDTSRPHDSETRASIDFRAKENVYKHPERWGKPSRFERYHDLYALGILLFEIGRWKLLPSMDSKNKGFEDIKKPEVIRDFLLDRGKYQLEHQAGTQYAKATIFCLKERNWKLIEEWQFQRMVRDEVLKHLQAGS